MTRRDINPAARRALESPASLSAMLPFLMIEHPHLAEPIRVVSDVMDYLRDGQLWLGVLFRATLPSDTESAPEARLTVPNVDRRVGNALRRLQDRAHVTLDVCSSADFDLSVDPRAPLGTVTPVYPPIRFQLVDIECTTAELSGTLMLRDFSQEPWPRLFATQSRVPGAFR